MGHAVIWCPQPERQGEVVSVASELADGSAAPAEGSEAENRAAVAWRYPARRSLDGLDHPPRIDQSIVSVAFRHKIPLGEAEPLGRFLAERIVSDVNDRSDDGRNFAPERGVSVAFCLTHDRLTGG